MKMKLSTEINTGLKRIPSSIDDEKLDLVMKTISLRLENPSAKIAFPQNCEGVDVLKQAYSALFCLIVEGVRCKEDDTNLRNLLKDCKWADDRISKFLSLLGKQRIPMQICLKQTSAQFPHIYDVTWKMNYIVKSSYSDIDGKALYFIDFIVGASKRKSDGSYSFEADTVRVVCTVNHLQSLVAALKAATRKLEAIADSVK